MSYITAVGASGVKYQLRALPVGTELPELPGIYVMCSRDAAGLWLAHYVGKTSGQRGLNSRVGVGIRNHEKWDAAHRRGATHIAAATTAGLSEAELCRIEGDLIQGLRPPLNEIAAPNLYGRRG